jgi:CheY-like chemotaxis protein/HPt (histidine-containing phosphotransfer) domain-containing protein
MDSDFQVESRLGEGSCFRFELLLNVASTTEQIVIDTLPVEAIHDRQALSGCRVLVAEDNPVNQMVIKGFLKRLELVVDVANDGNEALQLLAQHRYDAVLMDIQMPEMGGMEATENIRRQECFKALPIIALTAGVTQEERDKCKVCGMNDFIAKPINFDELTAVLSHWLAKKPCDNTQQLCDEFPRLNEKQLLRLKHNLGDEFPRFLTLFTSHSKTLLATLYDSLASQDLEQLKITLHSFKGMSGTMGATRLFQLCKQAENKVDTKPLDLQHNIAQIESEWLAVDAAIQQASTETKENVS